MTETYPANATGGATLSAADLLRLAAAPTFAVMAVLTSVLEDGQIDILCSAAHHASPLNGMTLMYALMSAFHASPWLNLSRRRRVGPERRALSNSQVSNQGVKL